MLYLVGYDIDTRTKPGRKRLHRAAKLLERFGTRVQWSLFEVHLPPDKFRMVRASLLEVINPREDSLRIYTLGEEAGAATEHIGVREPLDLFGVLVL